MVTATVQNNLTTPLYALGDATLTLPAVLGGDVLTRTYNLFQSEAASLVANPTVASSGTLSTTIDAAFFARLHDGDTALSWAWDPPRLSTERNLTGVYPRQAALAGLYGADNDYAVASTETQATTTVDSSAVILRGGPGAPGRQYDRREYRAEPGALRRDRQHSPRHRLQQRGRDAGRVAECALVSVCAG